VGVIDDRLESRTTLARMLEMNLSKVSEDLTTIDSQPLRELHDYPSWIAENDVVAIVLDERLQEQAEDAEGHVNYDGHQLVDFLRDHALDLPLYVVTAFSGDVELNQRLGQVEGIIDRTAFNGNPLAFAQRIARSGLRFFEENQRRFAEMAEAAASVAMGRASEEEVEKLRALQEALRIPLAADELSEQSRWINDISEQLRKLQNLKVEIQEYMAKRQEEE
jgi:hypothetical protein